MPSTRGGPRGIEESCDKGEKANINIAARGVETHASWQPQTERAKAKTDSKSRASFLRTPGIKNGQPWEDGRQRAHRVLQKLIALSAVTPIVTHTLRAGILPAALRVAPLRVSCAIRWDRSIRPWTLPTSRTSTARGVRAAHSDAEFNARQTHGVRGRAHRQLGLVRGLEGGLQLAGSNSYRSRPERSRKARTFESASSELMAIHTPAKPRHAPHRSPNMCAMRVDIGCCSNHRRRAVRRCYRPPNLLRDIWGARVPA